MGRRKTGVLLNVFLNGRLVGELERGTSGAVGFRYAASWLEWDKALPVSLSLPLRETRLTGSIVTAYLDNLLPDGEPLRRRIADRVHADGYDAVTLLAAIGRDCVGALQFMPAGQDPGPAGVVSGDPLSDEAIARRITELARAPLGNSEDDEFRISIAGAQEKTALLKIDGAWHLPHGTTATTHILKPQLGVLANGIDMRLSVENEHFCMQFIAMLGMPVAKTEIIDFAGQRVLSIERFDRLWTGNGRLLRLPQEDCCQALGVHPSSKYESEGGPGIAQVLQILKGSDQPLADRSLFLKAQVVYWLLGATDGHAKNFSICLMPGGRYSLTPLYDVMSAQPALDAGQLRQSKMKLAMAVGSGRHYAVGDVLPRHFRQLAKGNGVADATLDEIFTGLLRGVPPAIEKTVAAMPDAFPQALVDSITTGIEARLRLLNL